MENGTVHTVDYMTKMDMTKIVMIEKDTKKTVLILKVIIEKITTDMDDIDLMIKYHFEY